MQYTDKFNNESATNKPKSKSWGSAVHCQAKIESGGSLLTSFRKLEASHKQAEKWRCNPLPSLPADKPKNEIGGASLKSLGIKLETFHWQASERKWGYETDKLKSKSWGSTLSS
jgi:hypothetical protein